MVYTPEEKKRMDSLVECFGDYLRDSREIDVAYAEKSGYVRLITDENEESIYFPIQNYDQMLEMFFYDVVCDAVSAEMKRNPDLTNRTMDYSSAYRQIRKYVDKLAEDRDCALQKLDGFLASLKNAELLP